MRLVKATNICMYCSHVGMLHARLRMCFLSAGGAERIVCTLCYFKDRPAVRELGPAQGMLVAGDEFIVKSKEYFSKEERLNEAVVSGVKDFLSMFP